MKLRHYIALSIALVGTAICVALLMHPRPLTAGECDEVYRQYCNTPGVKASFLKAFALNDTTAADVTLLQAQDSATWAELIISICYDGQRDDYLHSDIILHPVNKADAAMMPDSTFNHEYLVVSRYSDMTIGFFHLENLKQEEVMIEYYIESITNTKIRNEENL